jgi:hypothetical protein
MESLSDSSHTFRMTGGLEACPLLADELGEHIGSPLQNMIKKGRG